jgi:hypothetical protein
MTAWIRRREFITLLGVRGRLRSLASSIDALL